MSVNREKIFLIKALLNPVFLAHAAAHWARFFFRITVKKIAFALRNDFYISLYYPAYLQGKIPDEGQEVVYKQGFLQNFNHGAARHKVNGTAEHPAKKRARLASVEIGFEDLPDWFQSFEDPENLLSLHRWGWLLTAAVELPSAEMKSLGIRVMEDWFVKMCDRRDHAAWESYSMSERISNAVMFFYVLRGFENKFSDEAVVLIERRLVETAVNLSRRIEFRGEATNNHVLNNARALYLIGRFASCDLLADIGREILLHEVPIMVTKSGFLRECSSNYQLLLLRSFLEVVQIAELTEDRVFAGWMGGVAASMVKAGWFFHVRDEEKGRWQTPIMGDVSPDFRSEWFASVCASLPAMKLYQAEGLHPVSYSGWNGIWKEGLPVVPQAIPARAACVFQEYADAGWYRLDYYGFTIIWRVGPDGCIPVYSHGHNDIFSFVLYFKGRPVIIDTGRYSYQNSEAGFYGKTAAAHNTFTLDDIEPYPITRYAYPPRYRTGRTEVRWEEAEDCFYFRIKHDGFKRISKEFTARREFRITRNSVKVCDEIEGCGSHSVKTFYHFAPGLRCIESGDGHNFRLVSESGAGDIKFTVRAEAARVLLMRGENQPGTHGWCFPEYGLAEPITTCIIESHAAFPYKADYTFQWN